EAVAGEVLLLVPPVGAGLARPVLGRCVPQLRALALVDRALRRGARAPVPGRPARGREPRRGPGRQRPTVARGAARAWRARVLRPRGYEPGPARDGVRRRALRRLPGTGPQGGLHGSDPFAGTRRGARGTAAARFAPREHARRVRSHRGGARSGAAAAAGRRAPRGRRGLRRRRDGGRLRQSPEPAVRLGAAQRRRHPRVRRRAGVRGGRRSAAPRPPPDPQALPGRSGRGGPARWRGSALGEGRAARHEPFVQVRRGYLPADSLRGRAGSPLAGTERRRAVPHGARLPRVTKPLEVQGLGYRLPGKGKGETGNGRLLVHEVSFTVGAGETLVLLGRSGSGKTTTLKLINRLLEPTVGEVRVAGERAADLPVTRLRLLDEPVGALDPITRVELQREFKALEGRLGKGMVFVTHDVREGLLLGTRIGLMLQGRLAFLGTPDEFRRSDNPECRAFMAA